MKNRVTIFSQREISLLMSLVAQMDPGTIDGEDINEVRSLIYKAKSHVIDRGGGAFWIPPYRIEG